ncbi:hypothetical protein TIFTF001_000621 [Ficus carica]|uniref:Uncharacterized protein n=1 Tax=Ficus carica TaxID=3494 RepID=A0AA87YWI2_FICCA|nr:hypothetical protein TIFTF001_000621 [Ficus carica]
MMMMMMMIMKCTHNDARRFVSHRDYGVSDSDSVGSVLTGRGEEDLVPSMWFEDFDGLIRCRSLAVEEKRTKARMVMKGGVWKYPSPCFVVGFG